MAQEDETNLIMNTFNVHPYSWDHGSTCTNLTQLGGGIHTFNTIETIVGRRDCLISPGTRFSYHRATVYYRSLGSIFVNIELLSYRT